MADTSRIKLNPQMLDVLKGVQERKTPTVIGEELGISRARVNKVIDKLVSCGAVHRKSALPAGADVGLEYPWCAAMDAPVLPAGAELRLEYTQGSQRDHRVQPVIRVRYGPWDVQGVPYLREDGRRPKDRLPERKIVVITDLDSGEERQFRASIRRRWAESDTRVHLAGVVTRVMVPDMTLMIACALGVPALFDVTEQAGRP